MAIRTVARIPRRLKRRARLAARSLLGDLLANAWGIENPVLRASALKPLVSLRRLQDLYLENPTGRVIVAEGLAAEGQPFRVAFTGSWRTSQSPLNVAYYLHLLFPTGPAKVEEVGSFPMRQLNRRALELANLPFAERPDLLLVQCNELLTWRPLEGVSACAPAALRMVFDYPSGRSWEEVQRSFRGHKKPLAAMRRAGFTSRLGSEHELATFYHNHYLPTVRSRHAAWGEVIPEAELQATLHLGAFLLLIEEPGGEVVSGAVRQRKSGVLYALAAGVKGGDRALSRRGAQIAVIYHSLCWGYDHGCWRYDAGLCAPFTSAGIYEHKRLWGFSPTHNPWKPHDLLLWSPDSHLAASAWMQANPFPVQAARWSGPVTDP